ncbi:MAG: tetratricopeptide repeat protein, partial [Chloroflexi bacterium]|nr:tetratricopeptide repeat protein [Chloroflexota bacterium]
MNPQDTAVSPKSKRPLFIIIAIIFAVVIGVGGTFFYLRNQESTFLQQGEEAVAAQNYKEAITFFNQAMAVQPEMVRQFDNAAMRGRGLAHFGDQNYQAAIDDFTISLNTTPDDSELLLAKANSHFTLQQYDAAISGFTAYLDVEPDDIAARMSRAAAYEKIGDETAAFADYDAALNTTPTLLQPRLIRLASFVANQDDAAILAESAEILTIDDAQYEPYFQSGLVYLRNRQDADAIANFQQATEADPTVATPLAHLAYVYALTEQFEVAEETANAALAIDDQSAMAMAVYGAVLLHSGDEAAGLEALNTAVS